MNTTKDETNQDQFITIDRAVLRLGKYTSWASELTPDQLCALLWMAGEYGIRSSLTDPHKVYGCKERQEVGRSAIVGFVKGRVMSTEEAKRKIRDSVSAVNRQ